MPSVAARREEFGQRERPAQGEAGRVLLEGEAFQAAAVVVPGVGVERFVFEEVEGAPAESVRAAARAEVDAPAGGATVLGGELVGDDLHFFDGFERGLEAFARGAVVVVVEAVDGDVVRVGGAAREREGAGLFGRRRGALDRAAARGVAVFGHVARRKRLLGDAAEREDEVERRARERGQALDLFARERGADDGARRVHGRRVALAHDRLLFVEARGPQGEVEARGASRDQFKPRRLFRREAFARDAQGVGARRQLDEAVTAFAVRHGGARGLRGGVRRRDARALDDGAVLVDDRAADGNVVEVLRVRRGGEE